MTVPPPGLSQSRWTRLLDVCRQWDGRLNPKNPSPPRWVDSKKGDR